MWLHVQKHCGEQIVYRMVSVLQIQSTWRDGIVGSDIPSRFLGKEGTRNVVRMKMKLSAVLVLRWMRIQWTSILCQCRKCSVGLSHQVHSSSVGSGCSQENKAAALHRAGLLPQLAGDTVQQWNANYLTVSELWTAKLGHQRDTGVKGAPGRKKGRVTFISPWGYMSSKLYPWLCSPAPSFPSRPLLFTYFAKITCKPWDSFWVWTRQILDTQRMVINQHILSNVRGA